MMTYGARRVLFERFMALPAEVGSIRRVLVSRFRGRVGLAGADRCGGQARSSSEAGARSAWVWMSGFRPRQQPVTLD